MTSPHRNQRIYLAVFILMGALIVGGSLPSTRVVESATAVGPTYPAGFSHCGDGEPPAGPYLNLSLGLIFDYDCENLTQSEEDGISDNCYVLVAGSVVQPVTGLCGVVRENTLPGVVTKEILIAVDSKIVGANTWVSPGGYCYNMISTTHLPGGPSFAYGISDCNVGTTGCLSVYYGAYGNAYDRIGDPSPEAFGGDALARAC